MVTEQAQPQTHTGSLTISEATQRSKRSYAACFKSKADRMPSTSANPSTGLQYDVKVRV